MRSVAERCGGERTAGGARGSAMLYPRCRSGSGRSWPSLPSHPARGEGDGVFAAASARGRLPFLRSRCFRGRSDVSRGHSHGGQPERATERGRCWVRSFDVTPRRLTSLAPCIACSRHRGARWPATEMDELRTLRVESVRVREMGRAWRDSGEIGRMERGALRACGTIRGQSGTVLGGVRACRALRGVWSAGQAGIGCVRGHARMSRERVRSRGRCK